MAKIDRAYLQLGWLLGRLVMGIRASFGSEDLPPVIPDEPETASLYLYGTPSASGNIGLRNGESVTYYDGAVLTELLPELPEWDKETYPYAVAWVEISQSLGLRSFNLWAFDDRCVYNTETLDLITYGPKYCVYKISATVTGTTLTDREWSDHGGGTIGGVISNTVTNMGLRYGSYKRLVWANHDVLVFGTNDVYLSASSEPTPITVTGIVGYSYNGTVFPELPEWDKTAYPYAYITKANQLSLASAVSFGMNEGYPSFKVTPTNHPFYFRGTDSWSGPYTADSITGEWGRCSAILWANFDVINAEDDAVYLAKSDPIPVYE